MSEAVTPGVRGEVSGGGPHQRREHRVQDGQRNEDQGARLRQQIQQQPGHQGAQCQAAQRRHGVPGGTGAGVVLGFQVRDGCGERGQQDAAGDALQYAGHQEHGQ
ncbi:hypothetical protein QF050_001096 [Arthrobacter sp. SLBN-112]|nr:hypothetical protein [Arthrobacter sp. SLBN-112]